MKDQVQALSFECFGALIDADTGCRQALEDEGILELLPESYDKFTAALQARIQHWQGTTYRHFREVTALSLQESLREFEVKVNDRTALRIADTIPNWPTYPDTVSALRRLGSHWPLCLVSNVDRLPLRKTAERLGIPFAEIVSGEDVRSYKPAPAHFQELLRRLGRPASGVFHVAANLVTDLRPAAELGMPAVWIQRQQDKPPADLSLAWSGSDLLGLAGKLGI